MKILNLTQHDATPEQVAAGVFEPPADVKENIRRWLTFEKPRSVTALKGAAFYLACAAEHLGATAAMIGGAPFFMRWLEDALLERGIEPIYAFSKREVIEEKDGRKVTVFRHAGFVRPFEKEEPRPRRQRPWAWEVEGR